MFLSRTKSLAQLLLIGISMLISFLLSLPIFLLLVFGSIQLVETAYLIGAAQQSAFFLARSEVVGRSSEGALQTLRRSMDHKIYRKRPSKEMVEISAPGLQISGKAVLP